MRSKRLRAGRVYVRRERPRAALTLTILLMLALFVFVFFGRPAIQELEGVSAAVHPPTEETQRVTQEILFEGMDAWLVSLGDADTSELARVEAARYVSRGAAGYVLSEGAVERVIGAIYPVQSQAETVAERLEREESIDCAVLNLSAPEARLQVTATPAKIQALTGAERTLRTLINAMGEHAQALDKGENEPVLVRAALSIEGEQAAAARAALSSAAGTNPGEVASSLIQALDEIASTCAKLYRAEQPTSLAFSSRLKYAQIELMVRHAKFLSGLSAA